MFHFENDIVYPFIRRKTCVKIHIQAFSSEFHTKYNGKTYKKNVGFLKDYLFHNYK